VGMSAGNSAGRTAVKSEPNVVPMIDIMLVLLIIFMIVTPLLASGFKATMPKADNLDDSPEQEDEVILGIDEGGRFFLNTRGISDEQLEDQLRAMFAGREDKILYLKADNQIKYGRVQEGIEIARRAGARVVASITETETAQVLFGAEKEEE
jgi:biopolymer transport protein TolR